MSNLHKSKRHNLICMFNDTSRYLDDIFTIDNPEFEKYIPDIHPAELQFNNANTSDKETSFLDLNIKVIGSDIHTSVYDKRDDLGFPIVNFPWLSGDVPRLPSYGIYILQLVRFARWFGFLIKRLLRLVGTWARKPVNHISWVALVTPTDRPKSVRNRCLIELFCGVVCVVTLPFWHFCWCMGLLS